MKDSTMFDNDKKAELKDYITEQFTESGDSHWIEGWIVGFTDPEHGKLDSLKEELFSHLRHLRKQIKIGDRVKILKISKVDSYFWDRERLKGLEGTVTFIKKRDNGPWYSVYIEDVAGDYYGSYSFFRVMIQKIGGPS